VTIKKETVTDFEKALEDAIEQENMAANACCEDCAQACAASSNGKNGYMQRMARWSRDFTLKEQATREAELVEALEWYAVSRSQHVNTIIQEEHWLDDGAIARAALSKLKAKGVVG